MNLYLDPWTTGAQGFIHVYISQSDEMNTFPLLAPHMGLQGGWREQLMPYIKDPRDHMKAQKQEVKKNKTKQNYKQ